MTESLGPERVERLRKKLCDKAKREPKFRFYTLYDKVCWTGDPFPGLRASESQPGSPRAWTESDSTEIESYGVERWLGELREELVEETYRPQPVRRVEDLEARWRRAFPWDPDDSGPGSAELPPC